MGGEEGEEEGEMIGTVRKMRIEGLSYIAADGPTDQHRSRVKRGVGEARSMQGDSEGASEDGGDRGTCGSGSTHNR